MDSSCAVMPGLVTLLFSQCTQTHGRTAAGGFANWFSNSAPCAASVGNARPLGSTSCADTETGEKVNMTDKTNPKAAGLNVNA